MKILSRLLLNLGVMLYCNPFNSYDGDYDDVKEGIGEGNILCKSVILIKY